VLLANGKTAPISTLKPGDVVAAVHTASGKSDGWMWDLTVPGNNDHDFYVVVQAGDAAVFVHNDRCEDGGPEYSTCTERAGDLAESTLKAS
jgi:hypothetical protein